MHRTDRILTSHGGALWRPEPLQSCHAEERLDEFAAAVPAAVWELVRRQVETGLDCVDDGEVSKRGGYSGYAKERLGGLEQRSFPAGQAPPVRHVADRDRQEFPGFFATGLGEVGIRRGSNPASNPTLCVAPLTYTGLEAVAADIANLQAALDGLDGEAPEAFLPAVTPGTIEHWLHDEHYGDEEAFLYAIAEAMAQEYRAIVDAGFVLQIDDPDIADGWQIQRHMELDAYRRYARLRVDALNHALDGIPAERVRLHLCWGSGHGPHKHDLPLRDFVDLLLAVDAQCYMLEAANPRHEHEWVIWEETRLPDGKLLMPGVVGHAADHVEHPELVAQRIVRLARLVGRENVIAGTDCGLGYRVSHPEIQWAKLESLVAGAELATRQLWPR